MKNFNWKKLFGFAAVFVILAALVLNYLGNRDGGFLGGAKGEMAFNQSMVMEEAAYFDDGADFAVATSGVSRGILPPSPEPGFPLEPDVDDRQIIRNGHLSIVVDDVEAGVTEIKAISAEIDGFVQDASVDRFDDDSQSGWVSIRVPAERFDDAMEAIKAIAARVESENINANDVTGQVVDNEARLRNLRAQESQYREILERAQTVDEVLSVTNQLNNVRWQIESTEGQLERLKEQVALSTINVNLVDEGDVEIFGVYWRPLLSLKQSLRGAVENITSTIDLIFDVVVNLPLLLVWAAILAFVAWLLIKFGKKVWKKIS